MKLDNLDFMIAAQIEHPDRLRNTEICLNYLKAIGINNVYIHEYYTDEPKLKQLSLKFNYKFSFIKNTYDNFPKMIALNKIFKETTNKYVMIYDVDVLIKKTSLEQAVDQLDQEADVVYPYSGPFYDIPKETVEQLYNNLNTEINIDECKLFNINSVGGCVAFTREAFESGGGCNTNFKNVGYDDTEMHMRYAKLQYNIKRTAGVLLHMNHHRGDTSFNHNTFDEHNKAEYVKIARMSTQDLLSYINTWN